MSVDDAISEGLAPDNRHPAIKNADHSKISAFVFCLTPPRGAGVSTPDHIHGDDGADVLLYEMPPHPPPNTVKRPKPGLRHYLLWLADQAKGFRCLVVSPLAASYMLGGRIVTEDRTRQQGDRIGTWRNYPVYIDVSFSYGGGYFAENRGGVSLGHFTVYEDER